MTTTKKRIDNDMKQVLFVVGVIFALGAVATGAASLISWSPVPILVLLGVAAFLAMIGGLIWLAERIFPDGAR